MSDGDFEEAAEAIYAEILEALAEAWEPVLEVGACVAAVGRFAVELVRAVWRLRP